MRCIYKTDNGVLSKLKDFEPDVWVNLITPDMDEIVSTAKQYGIDVNDMKAALDDEESSRVQLEDGYTLILVDIRRLRCVITRMLIRQFLWVSCL